VLVLVSMPVDFSSSPPPDEGMAVVGGDGGLASSARHSMEPLVEALHEACWLLNLYSQPPLAPQCLLYSNNFGQSRAEKRSRERPDTESTIANGGEITNESCCSLFNQPRASRGLSRSLPMHTSSSGVLDSSLCVPMRFQHYQWRFSV
jgi:hypothetical protein